MNKTIQFSVKENYVSPVMKIAAMRTRRHILAGSGDSSLYGDSNKAGNDMEDDENYSYTF